MGPLISVIMTVYNGENFVRESLRSIFLQKEITEQIEIIIYNDSSTDNSVQIIKNEIFSLCRIVNLHPSYLIIDKKRDFNQGCAFGRNTAISYANSKYIAIQDSDDVSLPYRLKKELDFLEKNPDIFCVGGWADKIDEEGTIFDEMIYSPENHSDIVKAIVTECKNPIIDPSVMFRKDQFIKLGGYYMHSYMDIIPDFDLWLRAILQGYKFYNLQEKLTQYRVHQQGTTISKKEKMISQHVRVWKKFMKEFTLINKGFSHNNINNKIDPY